MLHKVLARAIEQKNESIIQIWKGKVKPSLHTGDTYGVCVCIFM